MGEEWLRKGLSIWQAMFSAGSLWSYLETNHERVGERTKLVGGQHRGRGGKEGIGSFICIRLERMVEMK